MIIATGFTDHSWLFYSGTHANFEGTAVRKSSKLYESEYFPDPDGREVWESSLFCYTWLQLTTDMVMIGLLSPHGHRVILFYY